jgi:hypothetical protein
MASESRAAPKLVLLQGNERKLEHEFDLIRSAVALLAAGGARRVTLVGMSIDERALREAGFLVQASGMVMRAEKREAGFDITIEASG